MWINVKMTTLAVLCFLLTVTTANAGPWGGGGLGLFGDFGVFWFGGWEYGGNHGGFYGLGLGFPLGFYDPERAQARFENRFDSLMTQYDEGVAGSSDFFMSTEYDHIVDKTELLTDRYGLFLSGVERNVDRLGDIISIANDDLTYYNNLLADNQADDSLSPERLARIEQWIMRVTDRIDTKVDFLTDKQTTLQTNLPTYQSFQTELSTFLSDIVAAGGGTTDGTTSSLMALVDSSKSLSPLAVMDSATTLCDPSGLGLTTAAVPEPAAATLIMLAGGTISIMRGRRARRA